MALPPQVTVINGGPTRVRCGVTFAPGESVIDAERLELMADLGVMQRSQNLGITYDLTCARASAPMFLGLALEANATVETS